MAVEKGKSRGVSRRIAVIGAGSWGTTLAGLIGAHGDVSLWARDERVVAQIAATRRNAKYLPELELESSIEVTTSIPAALDGADLVIMAVPSHGVRAICQGVAPHLDSGADVVSTVKGLEEATHLRMTQLIGSLLPGRHVGALSGPNLVHEIAAGSPAATVVAFDESEIAERVQDVLHSTVLRVYTSTDVIGCEIAGVVKNVIAIAVGISDAVGFGENTRAVLITRGLAEESRLGAALGANPQTFSGLAGVGDLVATCTSAQSRNRSVGMALGSGRPLAEITASMPTIAEGIRSARPLVDLGRAHGVELPIVEQVAAIIEGTTSPREAVRALMERRPGPE